MAKFCTNCGHALDPGAAFCAYCGAPLGDAGQQSPQPAQAAQPPQWQQPTGQWSPPRTQQQSAAPWQQPSAANEWHLAPGSAGGGWSPPRSATQVRAAPAGGARGGVPAPGWSDRVNDPELLSALAKQKRISKRVSAFIVPIPLVGFAIYGLVSDSMEFSTALLVGAIVSAVFLIFSGIGKRRSSGKNAYEGMVVDKKTGQRRHSSSRSGGSRNHSYYTELVTVVQTSTGEQKRIVERDDSRPMAWDYLQVGDRFRYHPEHAFPYELYDKSRAPYLCCAVCQKKNPITEDRCSKCGAPLLK